VVRTDNLATLISRVSWNSGSLNLLEPQGLPQANTGFFFTFSFYYLIVYESNQKMQEPGSCYSPLSSAGTWESPARPFLEDDIGRLRIDGCSLDYHQDPICSCYAYQQHRFYIHRAVLCSLTLTSGHCAYSESTRLPPAPAPRWIVEKQSISHSSLNRRRSLWSRCFGSRMHMRGHNSVSDEKRYFKLKNVGFDGATHGTLQCCYRGCWLVTD
jgi:hypothetical protein